MVAQRRHDYKLPGTSSVDKMSLLSFSNEQIIHNANSPGVSLGDSIKEKRKSAKLILVNEAFRSLTMLKTKESRNESDGTAPHCLIVKRASNPSEDLVDEDEVIEDDHVVQEVEYVKVGRQRKKKSYDKTNIRRSNRIKLKKIKSLWKD